MNHLVSGSYIGPSDELLYEINQDMKDVNNAAITHVAILKNKVGKPRLMQFNSVKKKILMKCRIVKFYLTFYRTKNCIKDFKNFPIIFARL